MMYSRQAAVTDFDIVVFVRLMLHRVCILPTSRRISRMRQPNCTKFDENVGHSPARIRASFQVSGFNINAETIRLHYQAPQYLVDFCQSVSSVASRQHLRSVSRGLLVVPRHRLSSYGRRAFSVACPAIWNWLSDSLRDPTISRDSFKRSLKTFLFLAYSCT